MNLTSIAKFTLIIAPALRQFVQWLFAFCKGDPKVAVQTMKQIQDHGAQLKNFQAEIDRQLDELEAKRRNAAATGQG